MTELIILTITIAAIYSLYQLVKTLRNRSLLRPEKNLLEVLEYDPELHELTITLRDGQTITGTPDSGTRNPTRDGILLHETRSGNAHAAATYIRADQITSLDVTERKHVCPDN